MKKFILFSVVSLLFAAWSAPKFQGQVTAEEVHTRDGIGHVLAKIAAGKTITVAYLGGSITAMNGWRNLTTEWLGKRFPNAKFKEIHASIGGTGSNLGVFRLEHDALRHNPDLLFVEFATNDSGRNPVDIWRSMEGIVRQTWKKDATTDIVFTYTITSTMMGDYGAGKCPVAASAMEQLADFYGIPSIGFGPRVTTEVKAGRLVMNMKDAEKETAVPVETPERDKEIAKALAKEGKILFAKDGVHPAMPGHGFYLKSIQAGFEKMIGLKVKAVDNNAKLNKVFVEDNLENAKMVAITQDMLTGKWSKLSKENSLYKSFSNRMGDIWLAETPGDTLKFKFKGTCCQIYDLLGPDGGQLWVTVDGKRSSKPRPRFDSYCTYHRIAQVPVFAGADGVHEVEIAVDSEQPSRQSVAFRLKDPEKEFKTPKYNGTRFWPSKIMLVGDLVK